MKRQECLNKALEIVSKDRQNDYGLPEKNFGVIANYWTNYLDSRGIKGTLTGFDVAAMMALLKIARIASSPAKEDNWVDLAGYAANGVEVSTGSSNGIEVATPAIKVDTTDSGVRWINLASSEKTA